MRNRLALAAVIALATIMSSCGVFKKVQAQPDTTTNTTIPNTTVTDSREAVIATLGDWQTMQTGGNIKLNAGSSFSSAIQVRMVRDQAIFISLRPMLGIEVGKLIITADSLYAVDKVHKRYVAEKVSILTSGVPVTVSDVQDMFLGRPFIIGKGIYNEQLESEMTFDTEGGSIVLIPIEKYKGYGYAFSFDKSLRIKALNITLRAVPLRLIKSNTATCAAPRLATSPMPSMWMPQSKKRKLLSRSATKISSGTVR